MSRWNRTNFLSTFVINNISECDMVMENFDKFQLVRPTKFYTIQEDDIQRPDLLSIRLYGKQDYWWIIGKVNAIDNWWNIQIGDVIVVPDMLDIEDFYFKIQGLSL